MNLEKSRPDLVSTAKTLISQCEAEFDCLESTNPLTSWTMHFEQVAESLKRGVHSNSITLLTATIHHAYVQLKCMRLMRIKGKYITPYESLKIEAKIWSLVCKCKKGEIPDNINEE